MTKRLFAMDPQTGTMHYVDYNEADDTFTVVEEADVTELLEWNRRLYNEAPDGWKEGASVARLHPLMRLRLERQGIIRADGDDTPYKRWLNDPDNRGWRIKPGRV